MTSDVIVAGRVSRAGECIDGRYQLETEIGAGGLGAVYRAMQTKLARQVAVKLLHEATYASDLQRARFEREARSLAALEHPNIVSILDYGLADGQPYIVTELLEGETLAQRLRAGSLPLEQGLRFADELLDALAYMHEAGVVHRDLKASNVFLQRVHAGERVKLLDFGLAKTTVSPGMKGDDTLTRDGTVVGTPAYMSPEQATGDVVDARSDVYSVGVLLYQMLTGRLPFAGDAIDQVRSHLVEPVPALERTSPSRRLDAALEAVIRRAMAKRRDDRFENARAMLHELAQIRDSRTLPPPAAGTQALLNARRALPPLADTLRWLRWLCVIAVVAQLLLLLLLARDVQGKAALVTLGERSQVALVALAERGKLLGARLAARWRGLPAAPADPGDTTAVKASPRSAADANRDGAAAQRAWRAEPQAAGSGALGPAGQGLGLNPPAQAPPGSDPTAAAAATNLGTGSPLSATSSGVGAGPPLSATGSGVGAGSPLSATSSGVGAGDPVGQGATPPLAAAGPDVSPDAPPGAVLDAPLAAAATGLLEASPPGAAAHVDLVVPGPPKSRNPWARGTPAELRGIRSAILAGGIGDDRVAGTLRTYSQSHPGDPRAQLLLGVMYLNRSWRADAVAQFASAIKTDLSARGAPEVLDNLTELVATGRAESEAAALIMRAYGTEALPALAKKISNTRAPDAVARLRALRARLDRAQGPRHPGPPK